MRVLTKTAAPIDLRTDETAHVPKGDARLDSPPVPPLPSETEDGRWEVRAYVDDTSRPFKNPMPWVQPS